MAGDYVSLDGVKTYLDITDTQEDKLLRDSILDVNQEIDMRIIPFADALPLTGIYLQQAKRAGLFYVVSCWKQEHNNAEAAATYVEKYESKMISLENSLKALPTNRTRPVAKSLDYDTEDPLFSQRIL